MITIPLTALLPVVFNLSAGSSFIVTLKEPQHVWVRGRVSAPGRIVGEVVPADWNRPIELPDTPLCKYELVVDHVGCIVEARGCGMMRQAPVCPKGL